MSYRYHYGLCGHFTGVFPPRHHTRILCPRCRHHDAVAAQLKHERRLRQVVVVAAFLFALCLALELAR